ncbi:MAG: ABC transporter ATP-binding protein, partial [Microcystis sp.]
MKEPLIELRGVSKRFGDNVILEGLDLTIYRGEALVIIGPSGTGKSTVLRVIAGLTGINAGEIRIKGQLRQGLLEDGREAMRTSLVFQQTALFDSLTVGENVGFYLYEQTNLKKARIRELVEESLEMVGLQGISDLYPSELSGGMRKRVAFARAIITNPDNRAANPELLLYDEPTAGLDPIASTIIEYLVRTLHEKSGSANTYVMVSHQQSTIRRTADRVVFLYQGKVQWQGVVADIDRTDHPMIRQFFSASIEGPIRTIV